MRFELFSIPFEIFKKEALVVKIKYFSQLFIFWFTFSFKIFSAIFLDFWNFVGDCFLFLEKVFCEKIFCQFSQFVLWLVSSGNIFSLGFDMLLHAVYFLNLSTIEVKWENSKTFDLYNVLHYFVGEFVKTLKIKIN